jgi:multiple antibiotic resistance protein
MLETSFFSSSLSTIGVATKIFGDLIMIIAPWGVFLNFLSYTEQDPAHRPRMALNITVACLMIMVLSLLGGDWLIGKFGGFQAFRLVGNAIVVRLGLSMLDGQTTTLKLSAEDRFSVAIVPLATPLLVGPGTISTIVLSRMNYAGSVVPFLVAFALVGACIYITLRSAAFVQVRLKSYGPVVFRVLNSITGLLVMSLGVSGLCECLLKMFPGLGALH